MGTVDERHYPCLALRLTAGLSYICNRRSHALFAVVSAIKNQKPNEKPVTPKKRERFAGPANSVPTPISQTIRGVS